MDDGRPLIMNALEALQFVTAILVFFMALGEVRDRNDGLAVTFAALGGLLLVGSGVVG